jgi:hypothetical protein
MWHEPNTVAHGQEMKRQSSNSRHRQPVSSANTIWEIKVFGFRGRGPKGHSWWCWRYFMRNASCRYMWVTYTIYNSWNCSRFLINFSNALFYFFYRFKKKTRNFVWSKLMRGAHRGADEPVLRNLTKLMRGNH